MRGIARLVVGEWAVFGTPLVRVETTVEAGERRHHHVRNRTIRRRAFRASVRSSAGNTSSMSHTPTRTSRPAVARRLVARTLVIGTVAVRSDLMHNGAVGSRAYRTGTAQSMSSPCSE